MKILVDAGHGPDYNPGVVEGYYEGNAMFTLARYLVEELQRYAGVTVTTTRKKAEEHPTLAARVAAIQGHEVFISLHSNAYSAESAQGVVCFHSQHRPDSARLGDRICDALEAAFKKQGSANTYSRGSQVWKTTGGEDYFYVVREAVKHPSIKAAFLVEHGFHTNRAECKVLNSDAGLRALAKADAKAIAEEYGLVEKVTPKSVYRVQVGAFTQRSNAEALLADLKRKGYTGIIVTEEKK